MNINILNCEEYKKKIFNHAIHYYIIKLIGSRFNEIKSINIKFVSLKEGLNGCIRQLEKGYFDIKISKYNNILKQLNTLAHECTHLKQELLGELSTHFEFNNNMRFQKYYIWKGKKIYRMKYYNRFWEVEAREKGKELQEQFIKTYNNLQGLY